MVYFSYENGTTQNLYRELLFTSDSSIYSGNGSFVYSYIETVYYEAPPGKKLYFDGFGLDFLPLTSGDGIDIEYKKDGDSNYSTIRSISASGGETSIYKTLPIECHSIRFKISMTSHNRIFIKRFFGTGKLIDDTR